jgi:hypothetical protein
MALNVFDTRRRLNRTAVSSMQPKIASKSSTGISDISLRASTLRVAVLRAREREWWQPAIPEPLSGFNTNVTSLKGNCAAGGPIYLDVNAR